MKVGRIADTEVCDVKTFAEYVCQELGTPHPTYKDTAILTKRVKDFTAQNPRTTWMTFCKTVDWCRRQKKRLANVYTVVAMVRYAFEAGVLPELDPTELDEETEAGLDAALLVETDPAWRSRLIGGQGRRARALILSEWQKTQSKPTRGRKRAT